MSSSSSSSSSSKKASGDKYAQFGPRMMGVTIVKPIVYGSIARYVGKSRKDDGYTHEWTLYLKPYRNEEMSSYIKEVHFHLHKSYPNPKRVVTSHPYQVSETGWGQFDVRIMIHFKDPNEPSLTLRHHLMLFRNGRNAHNLEADLNNDVVSEKYDEMIFKNPTEVMQDWLLISKPVTDGPWVHNTDFSEKIEETRQMIIDARVTVSREILVTKERLIEATENMRKYREEVAKKKEAKKKAASKQEKEEKKKK